MGDKRRRPHDAARNTHGSPHKKHKTYQTDRPGLSPPASDLQNGLILLLDQLAAEEARISLDTGSENHKIVHHALQLRTLLADRAQKSLSFEFQKNLDTAKLTTVPPYVQQTIKQAKGLPPLPAIAPHLEEAVFTHVSSQKQLVRGYNDGQVNYERLEFLGDANIELIATRPIYSHFPNLQASHMSELRELLVNNETLAGFSKAYNLPARLKHEQSMKDGKGWTKIMADLFEAYTAAVVLSDPENGFTTAETWLLELWSPVLLNYRAPIVQNPRARDDVNKLIMAPGIKVEYRMERDMEMIAGKQKFFMGLYLTGWGFDDEWLGSGEAKSKAEACVHAATDALQNSMTKLMEANAEKLKIYPPKEKVADKGGAKAPEVDHGGYDRARSSLLPQL
ncbi:ribonuclease III [Lophiostoma macrostomum CBS 122681]|uniref:Ribonuclease III n=1 Tax=Lophiostoma macrostomum CBS 122681 TaxID=1314788 RepID=A0A6A6T5A0_9PLEO|nr:ribonuclease III [Lophiostoma macrostomum CBS 122681]